MVHLSVPANLLLMGEYAVTEEGGIGFSVSVERRLDVSILEGDGFEAFSRTTPGGEDKIDLSDRALLVPFIIYELRRRHIIPQAGLEGKLLVDSSPFYADGGRKLGLGSSAAVTVGVCAALMELAGVPKPKLESLMPELAHRIHRDHQGGKGSGYDVFTSYFGGTGVFTGGTEPRFEPVHLDWLPPIHVRSGAKAVRSGSAVAAYTRWKSENLDEWSAFLQRSNAAVQGFREATTWAAARKHLLQAKEIGLHLGRCIDVPADVEAYSHVAGRGLVKALGAGNELAALFPQDDPDPGWLAAPLSSEGLVWH